MLIKLFIAAKSPGEMRNVIKPEELGVESYIERMHNLFKSFMERDSNSPHSKFMFVMERLQTRFSELQRGEEVVGNGRGKPTLAQIAAGAQGSTPVTPSTGQAQGLHLLSEAAMSGNQQPVPPQQQQQQQQQGQPPQQQHPQGHPPPGWYPQPQSGEIPQQLQMDPNAYGQYPTDAMATYEGFDYGLGMASMGMDGAISGLFMADGLWNYNQPQGQIYPGWS